MNPFLDKYNKCYQNIIVINTEPVGKLNSLIKKLNPPKLSSFKNNNLCCQENGCILAIKSLKNSCKLMSINELPDLFSFLVSNGYTIDTNITKMISDSDIRFSNKLICFISKN